MWEYSLVELDRKRAQKAAARKLSSRIQDCLQAAGMTQRELGAWLYSTKGEQKTQSSVSRWLKGGPGIVALAVNVGALVRLAEAAGRDPLHVLTGRHSAAAEKMSDQQAAVWFARRCRLATEAIERVEGADIGADLPAKEWFDRILLIHETLLPGA